jgi:1-acyl-sn-glycerol-3-phosphate acyltransferase
MKNEIRIPWFHHFTNGVFRVLAHILLDLHIEGLERTPKQGPLIVAINHTAFLEPFLGATFIRPDVLPMTKAELFKFPYGFLFSAYGAFPVRRGEGDLAAFRHALQILRQGHVMLILPEGTRTKSGTLEEAREGTALIAIKSGAPILPVGMWGCAQFRHNLRRLRRTAVGVCIGDPLTIALQEGKTSREDLRAITGELMHYIARLLPAEYRGRYEDVERMNPRFVKLLQQTA